MAVNGVAAGTAAAAVAVAAAEAAAALGSAEAELAYQLTTQAVKEQAAAVIPLLVLSLTSVSEGLAAYTATVAAGKAADEAVKTEWQSAKWNS